MQDAQSPKPDTGLNIIGGKRTTSGSNGNIARPGIDSAEADLDAVNHVFTASNTAGASSDVWLHYGGIGPDQLNANFPDGDVIRLSFSQVKLPDLTDHPIFVLATLDQVIQQPDNETGVGTGFTITSPGAQVVDLPLSQFSRDFLGDIDDIIIGFTTHGAKGASFSLNSIEVATPEPATLSLLTCISLTLCIRRPWRSDQRGS